MATGPGLLNNIMQPNLKRANAFSVAGYNRAADDVTKGYNEAQGYQRPYSEFGTDQLLKFQDWLKNPTINDPSYNFRFQQGQNAIENSAAARGGLLSGNALREINDYGQQAASQEYGNEYQRWLQRLGIGMSGANNMSTLATGRGNALGNIRIGQGNRHFDNTITGLNSILGAEQGLSGIISQQMGTWSGTGGMKKGG